MRVLVVAVCLFLSAPLVAQEDLTILKPDADGVSPRQQLSRYLNAEVTRALDARRAAIAALKTPEDLIKRQRDLKARFLEALGDFPEKTPLNARIVGTLPRDGYRIEKVIYESRPRHHVTALYYRPDGPGPFPAVLVPCGHDPTGKAAPNYQRGCILLARNGIAALCYDPIGQGERVQRLDRDGKPALKGSTTEHTMAGIGALLVGRCTASYRVWDGIRSLDYLASRPEIDPKRLGVTGCSGGGTLTSYLMALDDRVEAAAPSCYITSLERLFATLGPQDAEQNIPGQVAFGMDHADYLEMRAPKPTLIRASTRDFFDIQGTWTTFREAKQVYGLMDHPERVDLVEANEGHGYTLPHREGMVRWMRRWLLKQDDAVVEGTIEPSPDRELLCTKSGQVLREFDDRSVFDFNAERADELARKRAEHQKTLGKEEWLAQVRRLIALPEKIPPAKREERGVFKWSGAVVRKLVFTTEPGIEVPGWLIEPEEGPVHRTLEVILNDIRVWSNPREGLADFLKKREIRVLYLDLRGTGESAPSTKPGPFGADMKEAFLAQHLARPLLGQRVFDLLSVLRALDDEAPDGVNMRAKGGYGPIALHAALFEPHRIASLRLFESVMSWSDVVRTPVSTDQLAGVVPGALKSYDLPDLAALLSPRLLDVVWSMDATGRPVSQAQVEATYAAAIEAYRAGNAENALTLRAGLAEAKPRALFRTVDLAVGEFQNLPPDRNGWASKVKLLKVEEQRDPIRQAIRSARVTVEINGETVTLDSGNYNLPITVVSVQVDCPVTGGYRANSDADPWGLVKDARIRVWPAGSPWIEPGTFKYPARQRWFASSTQMANEPVYVDGGENPATRKVYYHNGLDIGGAEGMVEVIAARGGTVVSAGEAVQVGLDDTPAKPRYDVVYIRDDQDWYYRYSHLQSIDPAMKPGAVVRMGQKVGVLGKEGGSGGWSHLHFDITSRQPSGKWGTEEGYAFLWQSYRDEHRPELLAVARPHRFAAVGASVTIDGSKSWSRSGRIEKFEWTFADGGTATGARVEKTYNKPGSYSEILKVTDAHGQVAHDFAIVQILDPARPDWLPPTIHAAYAPTFGIKPGDPVTFKVRTFRTTEGRETWDFGDGSPSVVVKSDGNAVKLAKDGYAVTRHTFARPGQYLVRVERVDDRGAPALARLRVLVEDAPSDR